MRTTLVLIGNLIEQYGRTREEGQSDSYTQAYVNMMKHLLLCLLEGLSRHVEALVGIAQNHGVVDKDFEDLVDFRTRTSATLGGGNRWKSSLPISELVTKNFDTEDLDTARLREIFFSASTLETKIRLLIDE